VPNKLILAEISYQMMLMGFNGTLYRDSKKNLFIPYNFSVGHYRILSSQHAIQEGNFMLEFRLPQGKPKNHDPLGLEPKHYAIVRITWPYPHVRLTEDLIHQNIDLVLEIPEGRTSKETIASSSEPIDKQGT
jgi:hypothetical protein